MWSLDFAHQYLSATPDLIVIMYLSQVLQVEESGAPQHDALPCIPHCSKTGASQSVHMNLEYRQVWLSNVTMMCIHQISNNVCMYVY